MSVNGLTTDRKTNKPKPDPTSWTVKGLNGVILTDAKGKDLAGLNAADAFAAVRANRRMGIFAAAIRT